MGESVTDVIQDLFPAYVSDIILSEYMRLTKELLNQELKKVQPNWITERANKTFLAHTTYFKIGCMAYNISRVLNNPLNVSAKNPNSFFYKKYHGDFYIGSLRRRSYRNHEKEAFCFNRERLTKDDLVRYLNNNGVKVKGGLKSLKNKDLWRLTMTF